MVSVACNCQKLQKHLHYKCVVALAAIALAIRKHFIHFFLIRVWFEFCANNNNIASPIKVGNKDVSLTKHDFIAHSFNFSPLCPIIKMAHKFIFTIHITTIHIIKMATFYSTCPLEYKITPLGSFVLSLKETDPVSWP